MDGFIFSRFRALDQLTFSQEAARIEGADRRAREYFSGRCTSPPKKKIKVRHHPPWSPTSGDAGPLESVRCYTPLHAELHELESLRERRFLIQSDLNDLGIELAALRAQVRTVEQMHKQIDETDRYVLSQFAEDTDDRTGAVQQRAQAERISALQKEAAELRQLIARLAKRLEPALIAELEQQVRKGVLEGHEARERCALLDERIREVCRREELFRASGDYKTVQANRARIQGLKRKVKHAMTVHNQLKQDFLARTGGAGGAPDAEADARVAALRERLAEEERAFRESHEQLLALKREHIEEANGLVEQRRMCVVRPIDLRTSRECVARVFAAFGGVESVAIYRESGGGFAVVAFERHAKVPQEVRIPAEGGVPEQSAGVAWAADGKTGAEGMSEFRAEEEMPAEGGHPEEEAEGGMSDQILAEPITPAEEEFVNGEKGEDAENDAEENSADGAEEENAETGAAEDGDPEEDDAGRDESPDNDEGDGAGEATDESEAAEQPLDAGSGDEPASDELGGDMDGF
jgi:hypothetical protein